MTREQKKNLKEIREAFQWTWDKMGNPHTSDHFNIPANGIEALNRLIESGESPAGNEGVLAQKIISVGHNDDCLFCGFKDKIATAALSVDKK